MIEEPLKFTLTIPNKPNFMKILRQRASLLCVYVENLWKITFFINSKKIDTTPNQMQKKD